MCYSVVKMRSFFWLVRPTIFLLIAFTFIYLIVSFYLLRDGHVERNSLMNAFNSLSLVHSGDISAGRNSEKKKGNEELNIMFLFNEADKNKQLQSSFRLCLTSLLSKVANPEAVHFYIMGDIESFNIATTLIHNLTNEIGIYDRPMVTYQGSSELKGNVSDIIWKIHQKISGKEHMFSNPLFYPCAVMHKILPPNISRIVQLDIDVVIDSDIAELFSLFDHFGPEQAIGIARENQPAYKHVLREYRKNNPGTRVGEPPPGGLTGVNNGVILFDLDKLRRSSKYNSFLTEKELTMLVKKYHFNGHLAGQDFFTLLSFEYEELFYILPCGWNRQLCSWWKHIVLDGTFDLYHNCSGPVHIWHGNCKTPLLNYTSAPRKLFASAGNGRES